MEWVGERGEVEGALCTQREGWAGRGELGWGGGRGNVGETKGEMG